MKRFSIVSIFIVLLTSALFGQQTDMLAPAPGAREILIHHKGYSLSYNTSYLQPSWVAYKVIKSQVNDAGNVKQKYVEDPQVTYNSASKKDYKQGGYIMAQLVSYLDLMHIPDAAEETFYLSNITPMKLAYYNHIWLETEKLIRLWTTDTDGLYVICGPVLADSPFPTIGDNNVSVPKRYFKVVYDQKNAKMIGFMFKNGMSSGKLSSYVMSIDEIEKETGIDLFASLDDDLESKLEAAVNPELWNFEYPE